MNDWLTRLRTLFREESAFVISPTLDLVEIRLFLMDHEFMRGNEITEETFDAICDCRVANLPGNLKRELSVFIDGYRIGYAEGLDRVPF